METETEQGIEAERAQVQAVSPLSISSLRQAVIAEPAYTRAVQLPQAHLAPNRRMQEK